MTHKTQLLRFKRPPLRQHQRVSFTVHSGHNILHVRSEGLPSNAKTTYTDSLFITCFILVAVIE